MLGAAQRRGSVLLGGAFAVCAAPCLGPVLATTLVLAGSTTGVGRGSILLASYSLGLAIPFVAVGLAFTHVMRPFRRVRDHYRVVQSVSGLVLVGFGALLFFDRSWWLSLAVNSGLRLIGMR